MAAAVLELDATAAGELVARIRAQLVSLDADVATAYHGGAAVVLGYGSGAKGWTALCADLFADVTMLRPTPAARLDRVLQLRRQELPTRAIGDALGVSAATVTGDLARLRARGEELPSNVVSLDGKRRPSRSTAATRDGSAPEAATGEPSSSPAATAALTELMRAALEQVAGCGARGMTCAELESATGWGHGRASSLLHRLERGVHVRRAGTFRGPHGVYVAG